MLAIVMAHFSQKSMSKIISTIFLVPLLVEMTAKDSQEPMPKAISMILLALLLIAITVIVRAQ